MSTHTIPSNICCWNCTFQDLPLSYSVPLQRKDDGTYETEGYFCSLACVKRFMVDRQYHETLADLFNRMVYEMYGIAETIPMLKQPQKALQKFVGPSGDTIETYRSGGVRK